MSDEILALLEYVYLKYIHCNCPYSTHVLGVRLSSFNRMKQHKFRRLVFTTSQFHLKFLLADTSQSVCS